LLAEFPSVVDAVRCAVETQRELDPTFSGGYRGLAMAQLVAAGGFQTRNLAETLTSEALARRAIALDAADAEAHSTLGRRCARAAIMKAPWPRPNELWL
jgi:hypothetical protein